MKHDLVYLENQNYLNKYIAANNAEILKDFMPLIENYGNISNGFDIKKHVLNDKIYEIFICSKNSKFNILIKPSGVYLMPFNSLKEYEEITTIIPKKHLSLFLHNLNQ